MNDFTKEELNMMADGIWILKEKCEMDDLTLNKLNGLEYKLCSMIDSCCEHLWTDGSGNHIVCARCGILGGKK